MPKKRSKYNFTYLFFIFIFSFCSSLAQTSEKTSLPALIKNLETIYDVRFSYASDEISGVEVSIPETDSLDKTLLFLNENTSFIFTQITDRYITVILKAKRNNRCGKIVDANTQLALEGATVKTGESNSTVFSNKEGGFYISENTVAEKITISYMGYETIQTSIKDLTSECPTIFLKPSISTLRHVMLETLFTKGISKKMDGSFVITTDNFGLLPGQVDGDVLQIAQNLPGVESVDETISNINIRGGTHDENNILWDDIKMYQSGHFFGLISAFNPDLTKKVTVVKNGTHPRYGEGVSGVIDMHSENKISSSFSGGAGFNMINTHAFAEIPITGNLGVQVSGRRSINDFLESPIYGLYEDRIFQDTEITAVESEEPGTVVNSENDFRFYDFSTKFLWNISEKGRINVNFLTIDNALEFTETIEGSSKSETSNLDQRSIVGGVSWSQKWNEKIQTSLLGYGSYYLLNSINEEIFTTQKLLQKNEVLETGLKFDVDLLFSEKVQLQTGYHFSETGIANTQDINLPRFRSYEKDVLRTHIGFANFQYHSTKDQTNINIGIRSNYFVKFDKTLWEPRLSIHQKLGKGFSVEALGEYKSQSTTQRIDFESDFLGVEKRRWVLSDNKEVPIIKSKQISLGLVYKKMNWFINLEGFYKTVDGITASNQGFQNQFQFSRTNGSYTAKGLEFVINKKTRSFSTWLSYMLMNNNYTFDVLTPSLFPSNLDIRHTATLASTYTHNKLKLALGVNWHSGKPYTQPLPGEEISIINGSPSIQYDAPNNEQLSNYFRTNLSAEYLWTLSEKTSAKFNFAILNVFNTKNILNTRYALDSDENGDPRINKIEEVSLGLTPNFSLQILF